MKHKELVSPVRSEESGDHLMRTAECNIAPDTLQLLSYVDYTLHTPFSVK